MLSHRVLSFVRCICCRQRCDGSLLTGAIITVTTLQRCLVTWHLASAWLHGLMICTQLCIILIFKLPREHIYRELKNDDYDGNNNNNNNNNPVKIAPWAEFQRRDITAKIVLRNRWILAEPPWTWPFMLLNLGSLNCCCCCVCRAWRWLICRWATTWDTWNRPCSLECHFCCRTSWTSWTRLSIRCSTNPSSMSVRRCVLLTFAQRLGKAWSGGISWPPLKI